MGDSSFLHTQYSTDVLGCNVFQGTMVEAVDTWNRPTNSRLNVIDSTQVRLQIIRLVPIYTAAPSL